MRASLPSLTEQKNALRQIIGCPWTAGGRGPKSFDCWGLVYYVQRDWFGRELPNYPLDPSKLSCISKVFEAASKELEWEKLDAPKHGCVVGLSRSTIMHHVGLWLDFDGGLIFHAYKGHGVLGQRAEVMRASGWGRIDFYWNTKW